MKDYLAIDIEEGNYRFLLAPETLELSIIMIRRVDYFGTPFFEAVGSQHEKDLALAALVKEFISVRSKLNASYPAT